MDYGFAPGITSQDELSRLMFERRGQTTLIQQRGGRTVRQFINHLNTASGIIRPVDNILLGSHANQAGNLDVLLFPGQEGLTTFETLEKSMKNASRSITIPDALIGHTPGEPPTKFFHIKGCNLGKARPFLEKLREALGDNVRVTAPKHFHALNYQLQYGVTEFMCYEYFIFRRDAFADKAAAVAAFESGNFPPRIDGSAVPNSEWPNWIPKQINRTKPDRVTLKLGISIGRRTTIDFSRIFEFNRGQFVYPPIKFQSAAQVPKTQPDQEAALEDALNNDPLFNVGHDFPMNERLGYASITDFLAGYKWKFEPNKPNKNELLCTGRRFEYTIIVPILAPATDNLIFNFYPNTGSPHASITNGLEESNTFFFETV